MNPMRASGTPEAASRDRGLARHSGAPSRAIATGRLAHALRGGLALAAFVVAVAAISFAPPARADSAKPPAAVVSALPDARLAGEGVLRWFGFKIYEAKLWTSSRGIDPRRFSASAFALDLRYSRALEGKSIALVSHEEIERLGLGDAQRRSAWRAAMLRIFPDVVEGDRLTGVHQPGRGTEFFLNDRRVGTIDDPEFGGAFFAIWLDARTSEPGLRERLFERPPDFERAKR